MHIIRKQIHIGTERKRHKHIHNYWDPIWIPPCNTKHQKEIILVMVSILC